MRCERIGAPPFRFRTDLVRKNERSVLAQFRFCCIVLRARAPRRKRFGPAALAKRTGPEVMNDAESTPTFCLLQRHGVYDGASDPIPGQSLRRPGCTIWRLNPRANTRDGRSACPSNAARKPTTCRTPQKAFPKACTPSLVRYESVAG